MKVWKTQIQNSLIEADESKKVEGGLTQVCDAAAQLLCDQDVFALQVPVCDGRFALCAEDLSVQVHQAARYRCRHRQPLWRLHGNSLQVVIQGTVLMVMSDEPQLGAGVARCHVRRHEAWEERQSNMTDENKKLFSSYWCSSCTARIYYWPVCNIALKSIAKVLLFYCVHFYLYLLEIIKVL